MPIRDRFFQSRDRFFQSRDRQGAVPDQQRQGNQEFATEEGKEWRQVGVP